MLYVLALNLLFKWRLISSRCVKLSFKLQEICAIKYKILNTSLWFIKSSLKRSKNSLPTPAMVSATKGYLILLHRLKKCRKPFRLLLRIRLRHLSTSYNQYIQLELWTSETAPSKRSRMAKWWAKIKETVCSFSQNNRYNERGRALVELPIFLHTIYTSTHWHSGEKYIIFNLQAHTTLTLVLLLFYSCAAVIYRVKSLFTHFHFTYYT